MQQRKKPVTIIAGFLGSGKTTLINKLIQSQPETTFAIIENEIGSQNIDKQLINLPEQTVFELTDGCICCSLNNDLKTTLEVLTLPIHKYDHLIIESTGIAEPGDIASVFLSVERLVSFYEINQIICLVDAIHFLDNLERELVLRKQLAVADTIILNKVENCDGSTLRQIEQLLDQIAPLAHLYKTNYGKVDGIEILEAYSFSSETLTPRPSFSSVRCLSSQKKHLVLAETLEIKGAFKEKSFLFWIEAFALFNKGNIYRIKGLVLFENQQIFNVVQGVGGGVTVSSTEIEASTDKQNTLVFIGRDIDREGIMKSMNELLA